MKEIVITCAVSLDSVSENSSSGNPGKSIWKVLPVVA